jgi:hypothetical protein
VHSTCIAFVEFAEVSIFTIIVDIMQILVNLYVLLEHNNVQGVIIVSDS